MRSGGHAGSTPAPSKKSPTGSITIAGSGKKASIAWMNIYASSKKRRRNMPVKNATSSSVTVEPAREVFLTRVFDAQRDVVFKAWTDPKQIAAWWGPHGFTNPVAEVDPRPGGAIRIDMRGPDGIVYPMTGTFREIVKPERIVMLCHAFDGKLEVLNDNTFADQNGKTKITVKAKVIKSTPEVTDAVAGMQDGWSQSLERLGDLLSSASPTADREIAATRVFDAPREIVWKMWTDRDHIVNWWGPKGSTTTMHTMDVRPGGTWDFIMHGPDGRDYPNKNIYREIVKPERLVYDHISGPPFHAIVTFTEEGNKTKINM